MNQFCLCPTYQINQTNVMLWNSYNKETIKTTN